MDKPVIVGEVISQLTAVNIEDISNALFERVKEISRQAIEKLKEAEKMIADDPVLGLLEATCDGDMEALNQLVSKYHLYKRNLSYFERQQVKQQILKEDLRWIIFSVVVGWVNTFSLNYSAYFSLPQEEREEILANIIGKAVAANLRGGEFIDIRKRVLEEELDGLENTTYSIPGTEPEDTSPEERESLYNKLFGKELTKREKAVADKILDNESVTKASKRGDSYKQLFGEDYKKNMEIKRKLKRKFKG